MSVYVVSDSGSIDINGDAEPVVTQETHTFSNEVCSQTLEDGRTYKDHIVSNSDKLSLVLHVGNVTSGPWPTLLYIYSMLRSMADNRQLVTIYTQVEVYRNMAIEQVSIPVSAPFKLRADITLDLVRVDLVGQFRREFFRSSFATRTPQGVTKFATILYDRQQIVSNPRIDDEDVPGPEIVTPRIEEIEVTGDFDLTWWERVQLMSMAAWEQIRAQGKTAVLVTWAAIKDNPAGFIQSVADSVAGGFPNGQLMGFLPENCRGFISQGMRMWVQCGMYYNSLSNCFDVLFTSSSGEQIYGGSAVPGCNMARGLNLKSDGAPFPIKGIFLIDPYPNSDKNPNAFVKDPATGAASAYLYFVEDEEDARKYESLVLGSDDLPLNYDFDELDYESSTSSTVTIVVLQSSFSVEGIAGQAMDELNLAGYAFATDGGAIEFSSQSLPEGLSLSSGGVLSGVPIQGGSRTATIVLRHEEAKDKTMTVEFAVTAPSIVLSQASANVEGEAGTAIDELDISSYVTVQNPNDGALAFAADSLPSGLSLSPEGILSGTPAGGYQGSVNVVIEYPYAEPKVFALVFDIAVREIIVLQDTVNVSGFVGEAVSADLSSCISVSPASLQVSFAAAGLPSGVSLSSAGILSGTPTAASTATVSATVSAEGAESKTISLVFAIVETAVTFSENPVLVEGETQTPIRIELMSYITAVPAGTIQSFSTADALPSGLDLSLAGVLSGTPTAADSSTISVSIEVRGKLAPVVLQVRFAITAAPVAYYNVTDATDVAGRYVLYSGTHGTTSAVYTNGTYYICYSFDFGQWGIAGYPTAGEPGGPGPMFWAMYGASGGGITGRYDALSGTPTPLSAYATVSAI